MSKRTDAQKLKLEASMAIPSGAGAWKVDTDDDLAVSVEAKHKGMSLVISQEKNNIDDDESWEYGSSLWCGVTDDYLFHITGDSLKVVLQKTCKRLDHLRRGLAHFVPHPIYLTRKK